MAQQKPPRSPSDSERRGRRLHRLPLRRSGDRLRRPTSCGGNKDREANVEMSERARGSKERKPSLAGSELVAIPSSEHLPATVPVEQIPVVVEA